METEKKHTTLSVATTIRTSLIIPTGPYYSYSYYLFYSLKKREGEETAPNICLYLDLITTAQLD